MPRQARLDISGGLHPISDLNERPPLKENRISCTLYHFALYSRLESGDPISLNPKGFLFLALVNLYKAMGGGWVLKADELTALAAGAAQK